MGVLDGIIKPSYAITPSLMPTLLKVTAIAFHSVMFYLSPGLVPMTMHAYTWQGALTYVFSYSPAYMGQVDAAAIGSSTTNQKSEGNEQELLGKLIEELERIMVVVARKEARNE